MSQVIQKMDVLKKIDDEDFDPHPTQRVGSSKLKRSLESKKDLSNANVSGNTLKRLKKGVDARKANMMQYKKTRNRLWSENDELVLLNGFRQYNSLHPKKEISFHDYIKDASSFDSSANQLTGKLRKSRKKYKDTNSRRMKAHQQKLFETSLKIWGGTNSDNSSRNEALRKESEEFYASLLNSYMADKGLDSASLGGATLDNFVEEWKEVMLAASYHDILRAKFARKVCGCRRHVYKAYFKSSTLYLV